jgi:hypothetical protein
MTKGRSARRLHIPAQFIDGAWECRFGGQIPAFLKTLEAKDLHKVLDEGAILLVGLTVKPRNPPEDKLKRLLRSYNDLSKELGTTILDSEYSYDPYFVEIRLAEANDREAKLLRTGRGGLWLLTEGIEASGLASTTIKLPPEILPNQVASVNHAYTKLSEIFETWRISHAGNIYKRVLYRERNGKWYPLDALRNRAVQKAEHETAVALWSAFMARMTGKCDSSPRK